MPPPSSASVPSDVGDETGVDPSMQVCLSEVSSITMLLVVVLVREIRSASQQMAGTFSGLMVYHEDASDSAATLLGRWCSATLLSC